MYIANASYNLRQVDLVGELTARERILQAATELFSDRGSASTSVREICSRARVGPPALYYHFGNKAGLFEAVVEQALNTTDFQTQLVEAVRAADRPQDKLRAYIETYLGRYPQQLLNIGLFVQDSMQLHNKSKQKTIQSYIGFYELAKEVIATGVSAGEYRVVDVDIAASCILGIVDSLVSGKARLGLEYDLQKTSAALVDLLTRGLLKNGQSDSESGRDRRE